MRAEYIPGHYVFMINMRCGYRLPFIPKNEFIHNSDTYSAETEREAVKEFIFVVMSASFIEDEIRDKFLKPLKAKYYEKYPELFI